MPDAGYKPHKEEIDLVSPNNDQAGSGSNTTPHNPGDDFENIINNQYSGGEAGRILRKAEGETKTGNGSGLESKDGGGASKSSKLKDTFMHGLAGKKALQGKEQAAEGGGLFNADKDKKKDDSKKPGSWKKRLAIGGVGGLVGAGGFFGIASIVQGPLGVTHFGQLVQSLTIADNHGQNEGRMWRHWRYMYYLNKGTPERSRLGWLGNEYADSIQRKFSARGIEPIRGGGLHNLQSGSRFDPEKWGATEGLVDRSPENVQKVLKERYGITTDIVNGKVEAKSMELFEARATGAKVFRAAGYRGVIALPYWVAAKKAGWSLNVLTLGDRAVQRGVDKRLARIKAFRENLSQKITKGSTATIASARAPNDDPNKPTGTSEAAGAVDDLSQGLEEARDAKLKGNPGPLEAFANKLSVKAGLSLTGGTALVCMIKGIADVADKLAQVNVELIRQRIFAAYSAAAGQIQHGDDEAHNSRVDEVATEAMAETLYDANTQTNAVDAQGIKALQGLNKSGSDLPGSMKVDPRGNFITQFLDHIPNIDGICAAVNSTIGIAALTIIGLIAAPVTTIVTVGVMGLAASLGFFTWISEWLAGTVVPPLAEGELLGSLNIYGGHDASSAVALGEGGTIVPKTAYDKIRREETAFQRQSFQNESFATRMFDIEDRRSFVAQVYDNTVAPTPQDTASKFASGLMNMGQTTVSTFGSIFTSRASAAADGTFAFDTPTIRHNNEQVNNPLVADPFDNAAIVAGRYDNAGAVVPGILDGPEGAELVARAKTCQGVVLQQTADPEHPNNMLWGIAAPIEGGIPTFKEIMDPANKCSDASEQWLRIQDFIWDSQLGNSYGCVEGDNQACIDVGIKAATETAATNGTAPTCAATTVPAEATGYVLKNCEDFNGTGIPARWTTYTGGGGDTVVDDKTSRQPSQCVVAAGFLNLIQTAEGKTCGMSSDFNGRYGFWEVRARAYPTGAGGQAGHPVLILWPDDVPWEKGGGELDYFESDVGQKDVGVFLHCAEPPQPSKENCFEAKLGVDPGQMHTYGFKWEAAAMTGYVDGVQKYTTSGNARAAKAQPPGSMHQTIQLDCIQCKAPVASGKMEIDWVHQYGK